MRYDDDVPAHNPLFDYDVLARAVAELLCTADNEAARVIALHGPWGSGKTTILLAIERELRGMLQDRAAILLFNAWKFDDRGTLSRALILSVVGELRTIVTNDDERQKLDELEESLYHALAVEERGPLTINWKSVVTELIALVLSLVKLDFVAAAVRQTFGKFSRLLLWGTDSKKEKDEKSPIVGEERIEKIGRILEQTTVKRNVVEVRSTEQFLSRFRDLITTLGSHQRKLFVLIDDLDRCLPENALQVFESIRLFLDATGCGYVVAVDREVIRRGLRLRYDKTGPTLFVNPDEYIEKTVSVSLDLPRLSRRDVMNMMVAYELSLTVGDQALIMAGVGMNPRRIKRYLNTLSLQFRIAEIARDKHVPISPALSTQASADRSIFIKVSLIAYRHSGIMTAVGDDPELLARLQKVATASQNADPANAQIVIKQGIEAEKSRIQELLSEESFWNVMRCDPDLNSRAATLPLLINWFRVEQAEDRDGAEDKQKHAVAS